jgi:hypothetical protein
VIPTRMPIPRYGHSWPFISQRDLARAHISDCPGYKHSVRMCSIVSCGVWGVLSGNVPDTVILLPKLAK